MKAMLKKPKVLWITIISVLLLAGLVWATAELSGQANALAQESGRNSAEMEELSLAVLKKPAGAKPPLCDWQLEKDLRKKIEENDKEYRGLINTAPAAGQAGEEYKSKVLALAGKYQELQELYATMWQDCKCTTRANLARKLANSRMKSAEVVASEVDSDKMKEMDAAQEELQQARQEYAQQAGENKELSEEDKKDIQAKIIPQIKTTTSKFISFASRVSVLLSKVQQTAKKATSGLNGLMSSAKELLSGGGSALLSATKALLGTSKSMVTNIKGLMDDAQIVTGASTAKPALGPS